MALVEHWSPEMKIADWIVKSGKSLREIEGITGVSRSKLAKFKSNEGCLTVSDLIGISVALGKNPRDIFERGASITAVDGAYTEIGARIGDALMDTVESRAKGGTDKLSIEDVVLWHQLTEGHLYKVDAVSPYLMAVQPMANLREDMRIIEVGENSLASTKIKKDGNRSASPADVETFVNSGISVRARHNLVAGYLGFDTKEDRRYFDRKLIHASPGGAVFVTTYISVLMLGYWTDGKEVIWNFSKEIATRSATAAELAEI